ncbi:uncharacterized protein LOC126824350 [Patella vulgata]|uniref:uncharacterized protein LOC126824350 n=1 Tax=Patella vulgata TaxID=6465 RepID=UPI0024A9ECA9|nr:uncharacterized protein LOC126824350 [Patella vulgata]
MKCLIHQNATQPCKLLVFNDNTWRHCVEYSKQWQTLDGEEKNIAITYRDVLEGTKEEASKVYGYHSRCYSRFCDKQRVERAQKRVAKEPAPPVKLQSTPSPKKRLRSHKPLSAAQSSTTGVKRAQKRVAKEPAPPVKPHSTPSPKKRLRSHKPLSAAQSSTTGVLPAICLICKKVDAYIKVVGNRVRDKLSKTQTLDAGLLREAATKKENESILKHIRGKDCVAIEVRYHDSCYKRYVSFLSRKTSSVKEDELPIFHRTFEVFANDIIRTKIIKGREIMYMSKLLHIFQNMVRKIEKLDASSFRSFQLKQKLQKYFPQLIFHRPAKHVKSEMVFIEDESHLDKIQSSTSETESENTGTETESENTGTETETDNTGTETTQTATAVKNTSLDSDTLHCFYTCAMKLRGEFLKTSGYDGHWPPLGLDFTVENAKSMIPVTLFNLVAWAIGASDEPTLEYYVEVDEAVNLKLISILQDIVSLQSKGRKHKSSLLISLNSL